MASFSFPLDLGERRRIEDNEIPAGAGLLLVAQVIEYVGFDALHRETVARGIPADGGGGIGADFHGGDVSGAAPGGRKRECALVGKAIEHAPAFRLCGYGGVVSELIQIKAGLLPLEEIDLEMQPERFDRHRTGVRAGQHPRQQGESLGLTDRRIVPLDDAGRREDRLQRCDEQFFSLVHGERERLQHEVVAVTIDDDTGESVAFTPDQPAEARIDTAPLAHAKGKAEAPLEKLLIQLLPLPGETPRHNLRLAIENGAAEQAILPVFQ